MHRCSVAALLGAVLLVAGCASLPNRSGGAELDTLVRMLESAEKQGNVPLIVSLFTEDAVIFHPVGPTSRGLPAVAAAYRALFAEQNLEVSFTVEDSTVDRHTGSAHGMRVGYLVSKETGGEVPIRDRYLASFRKEDGEWRIARLAWSPEHLR
ncbi:MAG: nuclear transport factor 2 family protein [Thermoanaerobaculia bacterium]